MAKYSNSPFGKMSGEVAGQIASSWKGINVIRSKATTVNQPNTASQKKQKAIFGVAAHLTSIFSDLVKDGYTQNYRHKTPQNVFMGRLLSSHCIDSDNASIDYSKVVLADGSLRPLKDVAVVEDALKLSVTWDDNSDQSRAEISDTVMLIVYDANTEKFLTNHESQRDDEKLELDLDVSLTGHKLGVFLFATNFDGETSDSSNFQIDAVV